MLATEQQCGLIVKRLWGQRCRRGAHEMERSAALRVALVDLRAGEQQRAQQRHVAGRRGARHGGADAFERRPQVAAGLHDEPHRVVRARLDCVPERRVARAVHLVDERAAAEQIAHDL